MARFSARATGQQTAKGSSGGGNIEGKMEAGMVKEAWYQLKRWYQQVRGKHYHPTREILDQVSADRAELYICCPPARLWVPILVQTSAVNNYIP